MTELTAEQCERMEKNRRDALKKLQEKKPKISTSQPHIEPVLPKEKLFAATFSTPAPKSTPSLASLVFKIDFELESATMFSASKTPSLTELFRSVAGHQFRTSDNRWTFPLVNYEELIRQIKIKCPKYNIKIINP